MKLSTTLIVKNELNNLKGLIPELAKFSDEIIIVDTGSTDGTISFLQETSLNYNLHYKSILWKNDFSYARNQAIDMAKYKFILWLDADDRIEKKEIEKLKELKRDFSNKNIYAFKIINSSDNTFSYQLRIFPNFENIYFVFPVHEQLSFNQQLFTIVFTDIEIIHKGYEDRNLLIKKQLRNISILESVENKDFYILLQIAESYKMIGEFEKAIFFLTKAIKERKNILNRESFGFAYVELFKLLSITKNFNKAFTFLKDSIDFAEDYPLIYYYLAREFFNEKDFFSAKKYFLLFLEKHQRKRYLNPVPIKIEDSAKFFLAKSFKKLGEITKALNIINDLVKNDPENVSYKKFKNNLESSLYD